jgi:hypothetical protein
MEQYVFAEFSALEMIELMYYSMVRRVLALLPPLSLWRASDRERVMYEYRQINGIDLRPSDGRRSVKVEGWWVGFGRNFHIDVYGMCLLDGLCNRWTLQ